MITNGDAKCESSNKDMEEKKAMSKKKVLVLVSILTFLCGGAIVAAIWGFLGQDDDALNNRNPDTQVTNFPPDTGNIGNTETPVPTAAPFTTPTVSPAPTLGPTTEQEGMLYKLFENYGPLWEDAINWIADSDLYETDDMNELTERYALVAFFYRTRGGNLWNFKQGWLSDSSVCEGWFGVSCKNGRVTKIELIENSLVGFLPSEIGLLTALTHFKILNSFELTGNIPTQFSTLSDLQVLSLTDNYITGIIPSELSQLTALKRLEFENNVLTGSIPTEINLLTILEYFSAGGNELSGSIPEISALTNLVSLELDRNKLGRYLPELRSLTNLDKLDLKTNKLVGTVPVLPDSITDCDLEWNSFTNTDNGIAKGCFD